MAAGEASPLYLSIFLLFFLFLLRILLFHVNHKVSILV